jgi:hypothetical protein
MAMLYLLGSVIVLVFSALLSMAGLGAAFLFVPLFYWMGVPLREAMATALLLNAISLAFASAVFIQGGLVRFRAALPIVAAAVIFSPAGAWSSQYAPRDTLLWLFAGFLIFAGAMMLFYRPAARNPGTRRLGAEATLGAGVGSVAGYLGGLLGVGGGNVIVPVLTWLGYDTRVAAGTTAFVVVFASLGGFLGHVSLGGLDLGFLAATGSAAIAGALAGSWLARFKLSSAQLKRVIGILLWLIAAKMVWSLVWTTMRCIAVSFGSAAWRPRRRRKGGSHEDRDPGNRLSRLRGTGPAGGQSAPEVGDRRCRDRKGERRSADHAVHQPGCHPRVGDRWHAGECPGGPGRGDLDHLAQRGPFRRSRRPEVTTP